MTDELAKKRWPGYWPWLERTIARPTSEKLMILVLIGLVLYTALILLDNLVLRPYLGDVIGYPEDLATYRERAEWILSGKIPYKDFHSESPPLIMYLFTIPQALGGDIWVYQAYFCTFSIMTVCVVYLGLRSFNDRLAFLTGLLYLFLPFGMIEIPLGAQDEAITVLFFLLPIIFMMNGRVLPTAISAVLGALTKLFNMLVFPWMLIGPNTRKERSRLLFYFILIVVVSLLPFLLLAPEDFLRFPRYYLLGNPDYPTGGSSISPWHFIRQAGIELPGWAGLGMTLGAISVSTYLSWKWRLTLWEGALFVMVAFFLFYPKILFVYFLMPVSLMMVWAVEDRRVMWRILAMAFPLFLSVCVSGNGMDPMFAGAWALSLVLSLIGWTLFFQAWLLTRTRTAFVDR
ncbi:MAG: hypothetical protein HPY73_02075 [Methanomassiliicoccales archaeon]|nr:MAG: hypothetical protein HPY73_02075 [Methanomassiliicoccales archaeon]